MKELAKLVYGAVWRSLIVAAVLTAFPLDIFWK